MLLINKKPREIWAFFIFYFILVYHFFYPINRFFISENFELIPGLFSKKSGIVNIFQQNNIVKQISIQSGLVYKGKKFRNYAHKVFIALETKQPNHWYRTTQGILSLQKHFSNDVIDAACKRALVYGAIQYKQIKSRIF